MVVDLDAPRGASEKLQAFMTLLTQWNRTVNLVSHRDESMLWVRHVLDSLQLVPLIQPGIKRGIDLGSGGGFPGLVLAIETGIMFELIESDQRKAAFLREAARVTQAPARVHATRIETARVEPASLVTARALAPVAKLLALAEPHLTAEGYCLFLKGANVANELTDAASEWHMHIQSVPSRTAPDAVVLRVSEITRVKSSD